LIATLKLRTHQAGADIACDTKSYSIRYKSGKGMLYGEVDQTSGQEIREIHKHHNGWIGNLNHANRTQIITVES
jgi:hypothetical protein